MVAPIPSLCKYFVTSLHKTINRGPTPEEIAAVKPHEPMSEETRREWHQTLAGLMDRRSAWNHCYSSADVRAIMEAVPIP